MVPTWFCQRCRKWINRNPKRGEGRHRRRRRLQHSLHSKWKHTHKLYQFVQRIFIDGIWNWICRPNEVQEEEEEEGGMEKSQKEKVGHLKENKGRHLSCEARSIMAFDGFGFSLSLPPPYKQARAPIWKIVAHRCGPIILKNCSLFSLSPLFSVDWNIFFCFPSSIFPLFLRVP